MGLNKKASRLFLICLALYLLLSFLVGVIVKVTSSENLDLLYLLSSILVSVPAFLIPAIVFRRRHDLPKFKAPRFGHIIAAVIIGIGALFLNEALSFLNEAIFFDVEIASNSTTAETIKDLSIPTMIIALAVIPPISEEFIMRGTLLEVWRRYSPIGAAILTSVLFALLHVAPSALIIYIGIGLLLAAVYLITRNVWLTVTVHFVNNLASVLAAIASKSDYSAGEELGAELSGEVGGMDIEALMSTQAGLIRLFSSALLIACIIIIPMILILRASCKRHGIGMYAAEQEIPEPAEDEGFTADMLPENEVEKPKASMWNDGLLWATIILLVLLNVIMGLVEFGVIEI